MRDTILHILSLRNGIKAVDLALNVMEKINPQRFSTEGYHLILEKLVKNGDIVELSYVDPDIPIRLKFMYFAKGTLFLTLKGHEIDADSPSENTVDRKSTSNSQISCRKT